MELGADSPRAAQSAVVSRAGAVRRFAQTARRNSRCLLTLVLLLANGPWVHAATLTKASTSRSDRKQAIDEMPLAQLTPDARARIQQVIEKPTMFRRMPIHEVDCDPKLHRFLIRYPEVVVNIWQLMGITKVSADRVGPYVFNASDGVGTVTKVELIYGDQDTHLLYCEGKYEGPLFQKPLTGRCVLLLKAGYKEDANERFHISNRLDVFLQIDNVAIDAVTRTLHPLVGKSADLNFVQTTDFLEKISRTSEENGTGMQRLAQRLENVDPQIRDQFSQLTQEIHTNAQGRVARLSAAQAVPR
ncbi:MAG: hypothetical protein KDA92_00990 [Planctomycetales bacterium]|nr:hypothetical protein [Planctomycetales bacterium]